MKIQNHIYIILFIGISILINTGCTQRLNQLANSSLDKKYTPFYQDKIEPGSKVVRARVHYSLEETKDGKYIYNQYYPETRIKTKQATYLDKNMRTNDGPYEIWWDDGAKNEKGQYKNGKKVGSWVYYYESGSYTKSEFISGTKEGLQESFDSKGNKESIFNYVNGVLEGLFEYYDDEGAITKKGVYENNEVVSSEILQPDVIEEDDSFKGVEEMPMWVNPECDAIDDLEQRKKCASRKMLEFIYKDIRYPSFPRSEDIQGMVIVRFVIDKEGNMDELEVIRGLCDDLAHECLRVVRKMPKWRPGKQDGDPVKVYYNLPIKFRLE